MSEEENTQVASPEAAAAEVSKEVSEALAKDPQRMLAERVNESLKDAGVDDPSKADATTNANSEPDKEYNEAKSRIKQALAERNKVFKERESVRQEAEAIKSEALKMRHQMEAEMNQFRQQMAGFQRWQADLRSDPAKALRGIGIDPEEFILGIAQGGTPEGRLNAQLRAQQEKLAEFERWQKDQLEAQQKKQQEAQQLEQKQFRSKVESDFMSMATSEKYGHVKRALDAGLISKSALVVEGDSIADQYREATGGREATLDDILEYIDTQFSSAIGKLSGANQVSKPTVREDKPSLGANSLSAEDAGERRALSRDLKSADSDERREAARQAVKAVLKKTANQD